jgi:gas vesicle protein
MDGESSTKFFAGLMLGAVVGAAVALLYAPQSGSETRRIVKEKASAIKEKASKIVSKIRGSVD